MNIVNGDNFAASGAVLLEHPAGMAAEAPAVSAPGDGTAPAAAGNGNRPPGDGSGPGAETVLSSSGANGSPMAAAQSAPDSSSPPQGATTPFRYSVLHLRGMDDSELVDVLRQSWRCDKKLEVWGRLAEVATPDSVIIKLLDVRGMGDNMLLAYPCDAPRDLNRGIYIQKNYGRSLLDEGHTHIRCELKLAPRAEREKHGNPLEVNVKPDSAIPLKKLPAALRKRTSGQHLIATDDAILISDLIYEQHLGLRKQEIDALGQRLKAQVDSDIQIARQSLDDILTERDSLQARLAEVQNSNLELGQAKASLETAVSDLQHRQAQEGEKLALMHESHEKAEKKMSQHLERLKKFIEEKATVLKQLELIDTGEFDQLFADRPAQVQPQEWLSFVEDLDGDYARAVSYIQAHLLQRDILYPRHVLENFFTLLRTNDLIVLAGDSGSGKTNLVQSFAAAIGGVAKIIPVKPNWTSSEDLLGYYNPLDKKYLPTPFLEALIEAGKNPDIPYLICLDEMNLARVEYYFADFLSKLEQRDGIPEIVLFSDSESSHVLSEVKQVLAIIRGAAERYPDKDELTFVGLLQDENINAELRRSFGFSEQDSLIKYHSEIRRMLAGVLNTPSSIAFPSNVRIIGAINIDETTHYLSPKILDRAHVMKFQSPLLTDWQSIIDQVSGYGFDDVSNPLDLGITHLGSRAPYPKFDLELPFCQRFVELNRDYFHPLGVEFGLRSIRQGLNFTRIFSDFNADADLAVNNFLLHKVLPKLAFDGNREATAGVTKLDLLFNLAAKLDSDLDPGETLEEEFSAKKALFSIASRAAANDGIVNYWS